MDVDETGWGFPGLPERCAFPGCGCSDGGDQHQPCLRDSLFAGRSVWHGTPGCHAYLGAPPSPTDPAALRMPDVTVERLAGAMHDQAVAILAALATDTEAGCTLCGDGHRHPGPPQKWHMSYHGVPLAALAADTEEEDR